MVETPYGVPSSPVIRGSLGECQVLFISRHGIGHTTLPSEVNYRANVFALKKLGASWLLSISAVGSLKEEVVPGQALIPSQIIDRTFKRENTFFGNGIVAHVPFATPFCPEFRRALFAASSDVAKRHGSKIHDGGTYVCMEGPAFSTRAESLLYRSWGGSVIGMTALPEAKLAREAELAYASLALVTDYDCWRSESADVNVEEILATLKKNSAFAKECLTALCQVLPQYSPSALAADALKYSIITRPDFIPERVKSELAPLIGRYVG